MHVRTQIASVFHLDKCLGCHTCSVACKNVWTNRRGAEYMWWNNVETKPGTGYPTAWEDQQRYRGGWERSNGGVALRSTSRSRILTGIFHQPHMGLCNAAVFKMVPQAVPQAVGGAAGWVGGVGAFGGFVIPPILAFAVGQIGVRGYGIGFIVFVFLALLSLAMTWVLKYGAARRVPVAAAADALA